MRLFDRNAVEVKPLAERKNKLSVQDAIDPVSYPVELSPEAKEDVLTAAEEIRSAKKRGAARILAFGAHSIKNGLAAVLIRLMSGGWITHFATNGAGIIHDWEFAYQGMTGENVEVYTKMGQFGIWNETGTFLNLAIIAGAYWGLGYGESVGTMVVNGGIRFDSNENLRGAVRAGSEEGADAETVLRAAAAADLLEVKNRFRISGDFLPVVHQYPNQSLAGASVRKKIPFTCHPMIGHDIIYTHPMNRPAAIGRAAERDFLAYADSVSRLEGGVYLSVGSAVMSPMIFEKSLSMSRNIARREGKSITDFSIHVVDLARSAWDWTHDGEPPQDNPAYYLRFCKTFSRMGGRMTYTSADNRSWLVALLETLENN